MATDKDTMGNGTIQLNTWVINGDLTLPQAERHLLEAGIVYQKKVFPFNEQGVHLVTRAGAVLAFSEANGKADNPGGANADGSDPTLQSIPILQSISRQFTR